MPGAFLHPFTRPLEDNFINIVKGRGALVWDDAGREYVDGMGSLWYCHVGHGREEIAEAVRGQMERIEAFHNFVRYTNEAADELAGRIAALSDLEHARVFFTNSGSEAVDTAIKLARLIQRLEGKPERRVLACRSHSYHGVAYGGTSAMGLTPNREGWGDLVPGFEHLPHNDLDAAKDLFERRGGEIAALLTEPVQGAGGVHPPPDGYLEGLRTLCDEHGALLVIDEVITGFGRLGKWFGYQHYGVTPDLVIFAKGVTSGYLPLGGVVLGPRACGALHADPDFVFRHGFTYSGHPTVCAAGLANLSIIEKENLLAGAGRIAARLGEGFQSMVGDGRVKAVRGVGGMWGVELVEGLDNVAVHERLLERGVISRALPGNVLSWCPPLPITGEQMDRCLQALAGALSS